MSPGNDRRHDHDGAGSGTGPAAELRALVLLVLDRLEPALARLRDPAAGGPAAGVPGPCPVCALRAAVRGERSESANRLADHLTELVAALRDGLGAAPADGSATREPAAPARRVQHVPIERVSGPRATTRVVQRVPIDRVPIERRAGTAVGGTAC